MISELVSSQLYLLLDTSIEKTVDEVLEFCLFFLKGQDLLIDESIKFLDENGYQMKQAIKCYRCQSSPHNKIWIAMGAQGREQLCTLHSCTCNEYMNMSHVAHADMDVICKHMLASRIATAWKIVEEVTMTDEQYTQFFHTKVMELSAGILNVPTNGNGHHLSASKS